MGVLCGNENGPNKNRRGTNDLNLPESILNNTNEFFKGLKIHQTDANRLLELLQEKLPKLLKADKDGLKTFLIEESGNPNYPESTKEFIGELINSAKLNFKDESLPLLAILFYASSQRDIFINSFKFINLAFRAGNVTGNALEILNQGFSKGVMDVAFKGFGVVKEAVGVAKQTQDLNKIRKDDLHKFLSYYVNFISYLPASILAKHSNEGVQIGDNYHSLLCNNVFNSNEQKNFVDQYFKKYEDFKEKEIDINYFFLDCYTDLKNDEEVRKKFLLDYNNLPLEEKKKLSLQGNENGN